MSDLPPLNDAPLKESQLVEEPVAGFVAGAAKAGFRKDGRIDLALIAAEEPVSAAGIFTRNRLAAAPVQVSRRHVSAGRARAILANSGGANAATGQPGIEAAERSCQAAAQALGCASDEVLPCSTGVIGLLLDAAKIEAAMPQLKADLSPDGLPRAAQAICTTDVFMKMARAEAQVDGRPVKVVGMAKGAGMIRPDMATMLSFVLTDAAASPEALKQALKEAAALSFNRISVDGDTSTNDTLLLLASGKAGNAELQPGQPGFKDFTRALTEVCQKLAAMIVADGEGAGHLVRVLVTGAESNEAARRMAYAIAHSPLSKTAMAAADPNWGRLLSAAGAEAARAGLAFAPEKTSLYIGDTVIAQGAVWTGAQAEEEAAAIMRRNRYQVRLELNEGQGSFWVLTSDLDHGYIDVNVEYRS